jgi:DNA-binding MarR family transcriptional regulator
VGSSRDRLAHEAWRVVADLFWGDESHTKVHDACESVGVTPPLMKALFSLEPRQPKSMRVLARDWRCDASWVTSVVDALEEKGYVAREVLSTDRRVKQVTITPLGEKAREQILDRLSVPPSGFATLDASETRTLRDLLRKVADHTP